MLPGGQGGNMVVAHRRLYLMHFLVDGLGARVVAEGDWSHLDAYRTIRAFMGQFVWWPGICLGMPSALVPVIGCVGWVENCAILTPCGCGISRTAFHAASPRSRGSGAVGLLLDTGPRSRG